MIFRPVAFVFVANFISSILSAQTVEPELFKIRTLADVHDLPMNVERIDLEFIANKKDSMRKADEILCALSEKSELKELRIYVPNSSRFPKDSLDRLKSFHNLQTLAIRDARDYKSKEFYMQVAAVKGVKHLNLAFL